MKNLTLFLLLFFCSCNYFNDEAKSSPSEIKEFEELVSLIEYENFSKFEIYSTQNMYNFLRLDHYTGKIDVIQYSVKNIKHSFISILSSVDLRKKGDQYSSNRFKLHKTTNMYNFLLLDTITGRIWRTQWSIKGKSYNYIEEIF